MAEWLHNSSNNVISTDAKVIKMWNKSSGEIFANIEPPADVNDIAVVQVDRFSYCMCTCMCFVRAYDGMRSDIVRCCAGREGRGLAAQDVSARIAAVQHR